MLKNWNKLLNTDCLVVDIRGRKVYPIFKVGSSSLKEAADKQITNKHIEKIDHIEILLRNPNDRFVSGLNTYCTQHNLNVKETWRLVEQGKLIDRHFAPQYVWLLHLYRFYKGLITLRPFEDISKITNIHKNGNESKKTRVPSVRSCVEPDKFLFEYLHRPIMLGNLIKENIDALS